MMSRITSRGKYHGNVKISVQDTRLSFLCGFFFVFAAVIFLRLIILQIIGHGFYEALASGQHQLYRELIPTRGIIYMQDDEEGERVAVATNQDLVFIYAEPRRIEDPQATSQALGTIFGYEEEEIALLKVRLDQPNDPYEPIEREVTEETLQNILALDLSGIHYERVSSRFYPEGSIGGQLLGFFGSNEDGTRSGHYGLEGYFDELLSGTPGFLRADRDVSGRLIAVGNRFIEGAVDGANLVLTIDRNIQFTVCTKLAEAVRRHSADGGSVVVIEPTSGKVLAMCGYPDFDPNHYGDVSSIYQFNNPVIFDAYEPGSIFKPITMAAALDTQAVFPDTVFEDTGSVTIQGSTINNSERKVYGKRTMTEVLEESINTGVIFAMRQTGRQTFIDYVYLFGFGASTGIELETEAPGTTASLSEPSEIYAATASFGQGITVTPLQMVMAYGAIANGGSLMKPQVIERVEYPDGSREEHVSTQVRRVMQEKTARLLGAMLVSVVEHGHGKRAGVPGYYIAGKTGTAQIPKKGGGGYDSTATIGSFAGFGPVQDPKFAMVVRIDNPKDVRFAESTAAPLFGEIADFLLKYFKVPPEREIK